LDEAVIDVAYHLYFKTYGFPDPDMEVRFHPTRRWRFDYVFPGKVAIEIHGGIFTDKPSHSSIAQRLRDMDKMNAAQLYGYLVLQFTPQQIRSGEFAESLTEALRLRSKIVATRPASLERETPAKRQG
jgi:hypothetical protein